MFLSNTFCFSGTQTTFDDAAKLVFNLHHFVFLLVDVHHHICSAMFACLMNYGELFWTVTSCDLCLYGVLPCFICLFCRRLTYLYELRNYPSNQHRNVSSNNHGIIAQSLVIFFPPHFHCCCFLSKINRILNLFTHLIY